MCSEEYVGAGVRPGDTVQNSYGLGLFTGGFGYHQGAELIGCTVIPTGSGRTERQVMLLRDLGSTVLLCTPSYALTICDKVVELGVDLRPLPLRLGIFGAEPWTEGMGRDRGKNGDKSGGRLLTHGNGRARCCL